jgi:hypothetical protein
VSVDGNQRSNQRRDIELDVAYTRGEGWKRARVRNASLGGLFIVPADAAERFVVGTRIKLKLEIPTQKELIEVGAIVRWLDQTGAGVQFDGLRARDVWALGKYFDLR